MKILKPSDYILQNSNIPGSSYPVWDSSVSYATGDKVFFSETFGEYEALKDNTGIKPSEDVSTWMFLQTANRYKMFDQFLNTQSENADSIDIEIYTYNSSGIFLGNLECDEISIQVVDADNNIIEDSAINLLADPADWEDYFFGNWFTNYKTNYYYSRETLNREIVYKISLKNSDIAKCGVCLVGEEEYVGATLFGVNLSALDYSRVQTDDSGITYLEQGNYAKNISLDVSIPTSGLDVFYKNLIDLRGKPNVFIGGGDFESLNVFGYIKKFETILSSPITSKCSLTLNGLI